MCEKQTRFHDISDSVPAPAKESLSMKYVLTVSKEKIKPRLTQNRAQEGGGGCRVNFRQPVSWFSASDSRAVTGVQGLPCMAGGADCGAGGEPSVRLAGCLGWQHQEAAAVSVGLASRSTGNAAGSRDYGAGTAELLSAPSNQSINPCLAFSEIKVRPPD